MNQLHNLRNFDAVFVLTRGAGQSDGSNQGYRDAQRFATRMTVVIVEVCDGGEVVVDMLAGALASVRRLRIPIENGVTTQAGLDAFVELGAELSVHTPLLWLSDPAPAHGDLVDVFPNTLCVHHVDDGVGSSAADMALSGRAAARVDLVVLSGKQRAGRELSDDLGGGVVRIDAFESDSPSLVARANESHRKVVRVTAPLDEQLDYAGLHQLAHFLSDWEFRFEGNRNDDNGGWALLRTHRNVFVEEAAESATTEDDLILIDLVPNAEHSDVVPERHRLAQDVIAFYPLSGAADGIPVVAGSMKAAARLVRDYALDATPVGGLPLPDDRWLAALDERLGAKRTALLAQPVAGRLNVLMLYDDRSTFTSTVFEHLDAFASYSRHNIYYMPATGDALPSSTQHAIDLSLFDVIIVHYSVRISLPDYLQARVARALERFHGLKLLFIQDEYDTTETARRWMDRLEFDIIFTCVPESGREYVYPAARFPHTEFLPTLTGYVPTNWRIDDFALPMASREVRLAYRGRMLPFHYGSLGWEKYCIGVDMKRHAHARGVNVDVEVDDSQRIYGDDWYRFLGGARATLGTESGSNVFDFDGTLKARIQAMRAENPDVSFEEVHRELLAPLEARIKMNQISPKIFEAARLRTALVLFEGEYSGVVKPHVHYIPLRQDYSNVDEVFAKLEDVGALQEMVDRAHRDLIESGEYSYHRFVEGVDRQIEQRMLHGARRRIYAVPALERSMYGGEVRQLDAKQATAWALFNALLVPDVGREDVSALVYVPPPAPREPVLRRFARALVRRVGRFLQHNRIIACTIKPFWRLLPVPLRRYVLNRVFG